MNGLATPGQHRRLVWKQGLGQRALLVLVVDYYLPVELKTATSAGQLVGLVLLMLMVACAASPQLLGKNKASGIVLAAVRTSAWSNSALLEVPPFALYADGTAIYTRDGQYWTARLTPVEVMAIWHRLEQAGFFEVPDEITLTPNWTDMDVGRIVAHTDKGWRMVRIYNPDFEPDGCARIDAVRREFLLLNEFSAEKEERWLPKELGVFLSGYLHAPSPSIPWPEGLTPPRESKLPPDHAEERGETTSYFYTISPREQVALADLLVAQASRDRAAVIVHKKKWSVGFVPYLPLIFDLFRALERHSDWPWGFDYRDKPTHPCKDAIRDGIWGTP